MPPKRFAASQGQARYRPIKASKAEQDLVLLSRPRSRYTVSRSGRGRDYRIPTRKLESNFVDSGEQTLACDTTGTIVLINTIAQGNTVNNRVGKKALVRTIQVRGFFQSQATTATNDAVVLLVWDRQSNGAAIPLITDIMTGVSGNAFTNDNNTSRFKILRRFEVVISGPNSAAAGPWNAQPEHCYIDAFVKVDREMFWNTSATTGVQSTIMQGACYLVSFGSVAATAATTAFVNCRTRFTEEY